MEFPVCTFDLRTGVLCSKCEDKLSRGELSPLDFDVMRFLLELEKRVQTLSSLSYLKSVKLDDYIFVVLGERSVSSLGQEALAQVRRGLSERFRLKAEVVEEFKDFNKFLQGLVSPARLLAVNKMWLPDQSVEMKAVIDDERKLPAPPNILSRFVKEFKGVDVSFEPQRRRLSTPR
ncbi:MAG: hypothetical protein QXV27_05845 [Candidatus Caldarchaeum sp.]